MSPLLNHVVLVIPIIALATGCGSSAAPPFVRQMAPTEVVLALPEDASRRQVLSNLFQQVSLVQEETVVATNYSVLAPSAVVTQKVAAHKLALVPPSGALPAGNRGRRVTTFTEGPSFWAIYDHGSERVDTLDTDIGRVYVCMSYEPSEIKVPGGWRCRVEWGGVDGSNPFPLPSAPLGADEKR